jgi:phosphate transport system substrate-binding protein
MMHIGSPTMRQSINGRWLLLPALCLVAGCSSRGASPVNNVGERSNGLSGKLVLTGSSTVAPLASEIAARFEEQHPDVRIDVQTGGSSRGIADAISGIADIGMASRNLAEDEQELQPHQVAIDGIALIVHQDNPVESLSREQVVDIYLDKINSWADVGGNDEEIVVANKAEGRGTLEVFCNHFGLDHAAIKADVIVGENQQAIKTVAGNPLAIGYVSIGAAEYEAAHGTPIKLLAADGIPAGRETVMSGEYPITRPLLLVTKGETDPLAKAFLEFALSPNVDDLIEAQSFVPPQR